MADEKNQDRAISKSEVQEGVQQALAMCATCSHTRGDHPGDSGCTVEREEKVTSAGKEVTRTLSCRCPEYWPVRHDRVDGLEVGERSVSFGGQVALRLDRRLTTEWWDEVQQSRSKLMLMVAVDVVGKRFVAKDYSLRETRQLHVTQVFFMEPDSGRVMDEHGNDVDPETGEILPGAS